MINLASTPSPLPLTSLIVCSRNRPDLLLETVESILEGKELPSELIIIDQSEKEHPILSDLEDQRCRVRYIWTRSRGVSKARNMGAVAATHHLLAFIDDDMRVSRNWYGVLMRALVKGGSRCVVTGRVLPDMTQKSGRFVPALVTREEARIYQGRIGTDVLPGCHMAIWRSGFEEIGGFDERLGPGTAFAGAEDNDYGLRVLEAGYQIAFVPDAVIYHRAWRSEKEYLPLIWGYGRGKGGYYTKYLSLEDSYILRRMCKDIAVRLIRFPWRVLHKPRLAFGDLVYILGVLSGAVEWSLCQQKSVLGNTFL